MLIELRNWWAWRKWRWYLLRHNLGKRWLSLIHPTLCDAPYNPHPDAADTWRCDRRPHLYPQVRHRRRGFLGLHPRRVW